MRRERNRKNKGVKAFRTGLWILAAGLLLCSCGSEMDKRETAERGESGLEQGIVRMEDLKEASESSEDKVKAEKNTAANQNVDAMDAEQGDVSEQEEAELLMIKVKDQIYVDTGKISTLLRCGVLDGEITSTVKAGELPGKNDQSNFGKGYGYQFGGNNTIDVNMDGEWHIFKKQIQTDVHSITITHGTTGERLELSRTERAGDFWEIIEQFEALDVKKSENQTPSTGYTYWLRMFDDAGQELHSVALVLGEILEIDNVRYSDYEKGTAAELFLAVDALWEADSSMADLVSTDRQTVDALEGVTMEVSYATSKGANLILTNDTGLEIDFGDSYSLQTYVDGVWYDIGYLVDNWAVNAIAYNVPKGGSRSWSVRWAWLHGELESGTYRIVKGIMDFRGTGDYTKYYLGAEFVIE